MSGSSRRAAWRRFRSRLTGAAITALELLVRPLPWRTAQRLGALLGRLAAVVARRERRRAEEHLAIAFPQLSPAERRRVAVRCFAHLGTSLFECLKLLSLDATQVAPWTEIEGAEVLAELRRAGRRILLLMNHCGNWEMLAPVLARLAVPASGLARQQDDPGFDRLMIRLRAHFGAGTVSRGTPGSARELLRTLRGGGALAILIDQDTRVEGTWVPFFGRPAYTPLAAAQLAHRHGLAVVPSFAERLPDGRHRVRFCPPLSLPADPVAATAAMTQVIEEQIRRRPEQWVWMHRRWRRQPPAAPAAAATVTAAKRGADATPPAPARDGDA